jgi:uncharacterized protein
LYNSSRGVELAATRNEGNRILKLHLTQGDGRNRITSCGANYVSVNGTQYTHSVRVTPERVMPWTVADPSRLAAADIEALLQHDPEIALLGTGPKMGFPTAQALRPLIDAKIGYEIMDTAAACRTYAILMAEERRVLAALIVV